MNIFGWDVGKKKQKETRFDFSIKGTDNLDKTYYDMIDTDVSLVIPWYVMATYASSVKNLPLVSAFAYSCMQRKLVNHFDELDHDYKKYINIVDGEVRVIGYPRDTETWFSLVDSMIKR